MFCKSSSFDHNSGITVTRLNALPCSWLLLLREEPLRSYRLKGEKLILVGGSPSASRYLFLSSNMPDEVVPAVGEAIPWVRVLKVRGWGQGEPGRKGDRKQ